MWIPQLLCDITVNKYVNFFVLYIWFEKAMESFISWLKQTLSSCAEPDIILDSLYPGLLLYDTVVDWLAILDGGVFRYP